MFESWSGYHLFKNLRLEIAGRILFAPFLPRLDYGLGRLLRR